MISFPYAKINIGLNILRKREDGFHEIETVFYPIKLCDILEIVENPKGSHMPLFHNTGILIDAPIDKNLCVKAYRLLKEDYKLPEISIHLHKIIPIGSGLGGGSSDAAHTLILLSRLFSLDIKISALKEYAAKIGSDCAFFIENKTSFARGRGEILRPINFDLSGWFLVLVKHQVQISTSEAYKFAIPKIPVRNLSESIFLIPENWNGIIQNDFENYLFVNYPELKEIKEKLYKLGAVYASMSGSGSTIFGLFRNEVDLNYQFNNCFVWSDILS